MSIFDQARTMVSHLEVCLPEKSITPNNIGEALKGSQRQLLKEALFVQYDKNEEDYLTEAVTKYAERATQAEANMAEMEVKFEERFAMLSMTAQQPQTYTSPPPQYPADPQPMQTAYLTTPTPPFIPPPATIHVPSPQQPPPYQQ